MEEDGVPLTKRNAVDLIEEAADKAEKPSFGRKITGLFSPKYDKDGYLILHENNSLTKEKGEPASSPFLTEDADGGKRGYENCGYGNCGYENCRYENRR